MVDSHICNLLLIQTEGKVAGLHRDVACRTCHRIVKKRTRENRHKIFIFIGEDKDLIQLFGHVQKHNAAFRLTCRLPHCCFDDDICTTAQAPLATEDDQAASSVKPIDR